MLGVLVHKAVLMRLQAHGLEQEVQRQAAVVAVPLGVQVQAGVGLVLGKDAERQDVLSPRLAVDATCAAGLVGVDD